MAFSLTTHNDVCKLVLCGCTGCDSKGCCKLETYTWNMKDLDNATVVARLFILMTFKKQELDDILHKFEKKCENKSHKNSCMMDDLKFTILEKLAENKTWQMCTGCITHYTCGKINFGEIVFLPLHVKLCKKHAKK
jgi:hypothetical protein